MRTLYMDCFSGISGDMILGALIDLGADADEIQRRLHTLPCADEFELIVQEATKFGFLGTDITVNIKTPEMQEPEAHEDRIRSRCGYSNIENIIERGTIGEKAAMLALRIFYNLAQAEAAVHATTIEEVHFHEVGAIDSIVDICGTAIAIELLEIDHIVCSPINLGGGTITFSHGTLGVPAPATAYLLRGQPVYGDIPSRGELTTPTGAAVAVTLSDEFMPLPPLKIISEGCGFGKRRTGVNALRVILGEQTEQTEDVVMLEANLDDMSAEELGYALGILREAGALEVYTVAAQMKKDRPGVVVHVIAPLAKRAQLERLLLLHTTTLGVRACKFERNVLKRHIVSVQTRYGQLRIKETVLDGQILRVKPEYDDVASAAKKYDETFANVTRCARDAYECKSK